MENIFSSAYDPSRPSSGGDFCIAFCNDLVVHRKAATSDVLFPLRTELAAFPVLKEWYVGTWGDSACWVLVLAPDTQFMEPLQLSDLRALLPHLATQQFPLASHAKHLLWWHNQVAFCSKCGSALQDSPTERAKICPSCQATWYPVIAPAIIVAITLGERILLAHNRNFPGTRHSVIAGFVEPGESLEDAVHREVHEEVGMQVTNVRYRSSQAWPFPNSLMLAFTAEAMDETISVDGVEIDSAGWFTEDSLPEIPNHGSVARHLIDEWLARPQKS